MADSSSDATMEALSRLSILQATLLAMAWPILLLALPYGLALIRRAIVLMSSNDNGGIQAVVGFHMRVASWPALILLLVVPPVIFLFAWRTAKRA